MPRWFRDYRCGHSLVCCSHPWRAVVAPGEAAASEARIVASGQEGPALAARWRVGMVTRGALTMLRQPGGRCAFVESDRGCEVHRAAGLDGLVASCRNFPRSVVATPDHWEVAFTTACPTAAGMLVAASGAFEWAVVGGHGWGYPPRLVVPERFILSHQRDASLAEVEALRAGWLAALGDGSEAVEVTRGLAAHPLRPGVDGDEAEVVGEALTPMVLRQLSETLAAIPDRPWAGRAREIWSITAAPLRPNAWEARLLGRFAALHVVAAGLHEEPRIADSLAAIGSRLGHTFAVARGLMRLGSERELAWRDALVATAQLIT